MPASFLLRTAPQWAGDLVIRLWSGHFCITIWINGQKGVFLMPVSQEQEKILRALDEVWSPLSDPKGCSVLEEGIFTRRSRYAKIRVLSQIQCPHVSHRLLAFLWPHNSAEEKFSLKHGRGYYIYNTKKCISNQNDPISGDENGEKKNFCFAPKWLVVSDQHHYNKQAVFQSLFLVKRYLFQFHESIGFYLGTGHCVVFGC